MGRSITLNLPEDTWQNLIEAGLDLDQKPETVAEDILIDIAADPLRRLFGSIKHPNSNVADRHDQYVGAAIQAERERD